MKSQHKHSIAIATQSWMAIQTWFPLLAESSSRFHRVHFVGCLIFRLCVGLSHKYTSPVQVWLSQGDNTPYWLFQGRPFTQPVGPFDWYSCLSKAKATLLCPLHWDKFRFLYNSRGHFLHAFLSFMSTLSLPVFFEPSSIEGVGWWATEVPRLQSRQWFHSWSGQMNPYTIST